MTVEVTSNDPRITIEKVLTGLKKRPIDNGFKIDVSDLYSEERKDIMIRVKIPALETPVDVDPLLNFHLSYFDIGAAQVITTESIVCIKRPEEVPQNQVVDKDFLDQRLRIDVTEVLDEAIQNANAGNYEAAQQVLNVMIGRVETHTNAAIKEPMLVDLRKAEEGVRSKQVISPLLSICKKMSLGVW